MSRPREVYRRTALHPDRGSQVLLASDLKSRNSGPTKDPNEDGWQIKSDMINLNGVPVQYRRRYMDLLNRYRGAFSRDQWDIGRCSILKQRIVLSDPNVVCSTPPYRIPHHLKHVVEEYVENMLAAGIIRPSSSPFCSPLLLVKKADADNSNPGLASNWRIVHDYRRLNSQTLSQSYPLRHLYEMIDEVANKKVWTVVDLTAGFLSQELEAGQSGLHLV